MAIPVLLWGAAAALGATGVFKGAQAVGDLNDAKEIGKRAERYYDEKFEELEEAKNITNKKFEELGKLKVEIFTHQINHVVNVIKKSKDSGSHIKDYDSQVSIEELKEMERMVKHSLNLSTNLLSSASTGALAGLGAYGTVPLLATASTGTAISTLSGAAATNATLAWLGGGSIASGGFGMAGGMMALGGIVAGPALAVGGFMLASKAEEALTKAKEYDAMVDEAVAKFALIEEGLKGLRANADEITYTLLELVKRFEKIKVNEPTEANFNQMVTVGKALKNVLDCKIMSDEGSPLPNIKHTCKGYLNC